MSWVYLLLAGFFEIGFTTCLKLADGFTRVVPSVLFVIFAAMSFWLLTRALHTIELGTAYAIWTGIGAFGTALVGIFFFGESTAMLRLLFLLLLIVSIIGLKLVSVVGQ